MTDISPVCDTYASLLDTYLPLRHIMSQWMILKKKTEQCKSLQYVNSYTKVDCHTTWCFHEQKENQSYNSEILWCFAMTLIQLGYYCIYASSRQFTVNNLKWSYEKGQCDWRIQTTLYLGNHTEISINGWHCSLYALKHLTSTYPTFTTRTRCIFLTLHILDSAHW